MFHELWAVLYAVAAAAAAGAAIWTARRVRSLLGRVLFGVLATTSLWYAFSAVQAAPTAFLTVPDVVWALLTALMVSGAVLFAGLVPPGLGLMRSVRSLVTVAGATAAVVFALQLAWLSVVSPTIPQYTPGWMLFHVAVALVYPLVGLRFLVAAFRTPRVGGCLPLILLGLAFLMLHTPHVVYRAAYAFEMAVFRPEGAPPMTPELAAALRSHATALGLQASVILLIVILALVIALAGVSRRRDHRAPWLVAVGGLVGLLAFTVAMALQAEMNHWSLFPEIVGGILFVCGAAGGLALYAHTAAPPVRQTFVAPRPMGGGLVPEVSPAPARDRPGGIHARLGLHEKK